MNPSSLQRRSLLAALLAGLAGPTWAQGTQGEAVPEVEDFEWTDAARERAVPARLYWPAGADGAVPLVVFSHGLGGSRYGYSYLGENFARHGTASLHVQHVGSDRSLWGGNRMTLYLRIFAAANANEALNRVQDVAYALDRLFDSERGARIDAKRVVAAGHSYGANTTLLAAGARVISGGEPVSLRNPRLSAAIVISAPPFYGEGDPTEILRPVQLPTLHVTATDDNIEIPGYGSGLSDRLATFEAIGSRRKTLAVFRGGSHSIFTDRAYTGGAELNPQVKSATRELSLAFFRSVYDGDASLLAGWGERWRPIVDRFQTLGS